MIKTFLSLFFITTICYSNNIPGNITDNCTLIPNTPFANEINSLVNSPFHYERFNEIKPNKNKCEYVRNTAFSNYQTIYNFTCPQEICFRWCSYATSCRFSLYSAKEKICVRSTDMELSDNFDESTKYFSNEYVAYNRKTAYVGYYSQLCNVYFSKRSCNTSGQCRWNRGKPGYNRESAVMGPNWCGRVKCKKF